MSPLTTTLSGTDSMAGVHASLHNAEDAAINALQAIVPPTLTSGQVLVGSGTATLTQDAGLAWDNATKTLTATKIAGTLQTASQPNLVVAQSQVTGLAASLAASIPESQVTGLVTDLAAKAPVSTAVTLTGSQTLTQKTLTSPHLTGPVVDSGGLAVLLGNVGIGGASQVNMGLYVLGGASGSVDQYGIVSNLLATSGATGSITGVSAGPNQPAGITTSLMCSFRAFTPNRGAGSTVTSAYGMNIDSITSGSTNNYGIYVGAPSGGSTTNEGIRNLGATYLGGPVVMGGAFQHQGGTLCFFNHVPAGQPVAAANASVLADCIALANNLKAGLQSLGLFS